MIKQDTWEAKPGIPTKFYIPVTLEIVAELPESFTTAIVTWKRGPKEFYVSRVFKDTGIVHNLNRAHSRSEADAMAASLLNTKAFA